MNLLKSAVLIRSSLSDICRVLLLVFALIGIANGLLTASAHAQECINEQLREQQIYALSTPDCRAYEQVSPVDKNFTDASGRPFLVESAPNGSMVTYFSLAPFPGVPSPGEFPTYLSSRAGESWSTQGLLPQAESSEVLNFSSVVGITEDLADAIIFDYPSVPSSALGEATSGQLNFYVRNNTTGTYRLLDGGTGSGESYFADSASNNRQILFESPELLSPKAVPGNNLYLWNEGQVKLVGVLPNNKAPGRGSVAGPGGPLIEAELGAGEAGGAKDHFYTQHTISEDGSRVFFTDIETGRIYMREPENETTIPVSEGEAFWRAATPNGSYVFYSEGGILYRFSFDSKTLEAKRESVGSAIGLLGVSNNGSYVYFVSGSGELDAWHEGTVIVVAILSVSNDKYDWVPSHEQGKADGPAQGEKSSIVTPDGKALLFASRQQLTNYSNNGLNELYLYDTTRPVSSDNPTCVSCNPMATSATSNAYLRQNLQGTLTPQEPNAFVARNLSSDGNHVFFQTQEALVPQDANGQMDVYEWEREGALDGNCKSGSGNTSGGCLYLISTGQSSDQSYFGDASTDGHDVFFFTRQSLVGQDRDDNVDLYDARVDGGIASQNTPGTPDPCAGEACRMVLGTPVVFDIPSTTVIGNGNIGPRMKAKKSKSKGKPKGRIKGKAKPRKKKGRRRTGSRSRTNGGSS